VSQLSISGEKKRLREVKEHSASDSAPKSSCKIRESLVMVSRNPQILRWPPKCDAELYKLGQIDCRGRWWLGAKNLHFLLPLLPKAEILTVWKRPEAECIDISGSILTRFRRGWSFRAADLRCRNSLRSVVSPWERIEDHPGHLEVNQNQ